MFHMRACSKLFIKCPYCVVILQLCNRSHFRKGHLQSVNTPCTKSTSTSFAHHNQQSLMDFTDYHYASEQQWFRVSAHPPYPMGKLRLLWITKPGWLKSGKICSWWRKKTRIHDFIQIVVCCQWCNRQGNVFLHSWGWLLLNERHQDITLCYNLADQVPIWI